MFFREIAKKEYYVFPRELEKNLVNFEVESLFSKAAFRVILIVAANFAFLLWLGNGRASIAQGLEKSSEIFIPPVYEAIAAEVTAPDSQENGEGKIFAGYLVGTNALSQKECEVALGERRNSERCGVDLMDAKLISEINALDSEYKKQQEKLAPKKVVVRKISCREENDDPSYSNTKGKHVDEDCCPDPDEWPKPGCVYSVAGYAIMLKGKPH